MITIKNAKFHNGKLDDESMKTFKEGFGNKKFQKVVKIEKKENVVENNTEVLIK